MRTDKISKPTRHQGKPGPILPPPDRKAILARLLDRQADAELFIGHVGAAERLAHAAAELREAGR